MNPKKTIQSTFLILVCFFASAAFNNAVASDLMNPEISASNDSTKIYNVVEKMPEIKGGMQEVYKYIKYPKKARNEGIEGRVFIKFVVNEQGKVENPQVLKDIGGGCGEAAIEGVKQLSFNPGTQNGKPVKVYFAMPVNFELRN